MQYYGVVRSKSFLAHHGIAGQKWGVKNGPPYPLERQSLQKAKVKYRTDSLKGTTHYNLDKWGSDRDHNILYITGLSGSGKSTIARSLRDKNTDVIHLDTYMEQMGEDTKAANQNKALNSFLERKGIPYRRINDGSLSGSKNLKQRFKIIDAFTEATEQFGREQYKKGRRVVMEGVELADETMYPDKSRLKGKPLALMNTGALRSAWRGAKRDDIKAYDLPTILLRAKDQAKWGKQLRNLRRVNS